MSTIRGNYRHRESLCRNCADLFRPTAYLRVASVERAGARAEIYDASFHSHYTVMADLGHEADPVAVAMVTFMQSVLDKAAISPPLGSQHVL